MNIRNWSIRSKIIALVSVPLVALTALWAFATVLTVGPATVLLASQDVLDQVGRPGEELAAELQQERRLSLIYLAGNASTPTARQDNVALTTQRARTDEAMAEFRRRSVDHADIGDELDRRLETVYTSLDAIPQQRAFIDSRDVDKPGALRFYSDVIGKMFMVFDLLSRYDDPVLSRRAGAMAQLGQAREVLGQVDALVAGASTAGKFQISEHGQLVQIIGTYRYLYATAVLDLDAETRARYNLLIQSPVFERLESMENTLITSGADNKTVPIGLIQWTRTHEQVSLQLRNFEQFTSDRVAEAAVPLAVRILGMLGAAGLLGLAAMVLSLVISVRVGRSLIRRLSDLHDAATDLAGKRLPDVVGRLRRGEEVDVEAETPRLEFGTDEIGQLGNAFSEVQVTAVQAAVDEAALRRGLNDVFLNIARRSQTLLHRQLALLDRMERRVTDPDELGDLFKVDHMATRMRRHAEDLVILAGAVPGRGWRNPVPMIDVVRGAVSEVEDYARVDIDVADDIAVVGRAVGDVIHLLAELIENGTSFSPPHTRVRVGGQTVPNGYAIEVEDRGLGMTPEELADANRRLAEPPDFDPANSARLGLFVVAQLGARHQIQVSLRVSPYGGVTAVLLVPSELVSRVEPALPRFAVAQPAGPNGRATNTVATRPAAPRELEAAPASAEPARKGKPAGETIGTVVVDGMELPGRRSTKRRKQATPVTSATSDTDNRPTEDGEDAPTLAIPQRPQSAVQAPGQTTADAEPGDDPEETTTMDGLPKRVRQANLAPQLRPGRQETAPVVPEAAPRSPDQARSLMSALQAGTNRGRRAAEAMMAGQPVPEQRAESARGTATPPSGAVLSPPPEARIPSAGSPTTVQSAAAADVSADSATEHRDADRDA
ncbi:nitrate- and nitrite sensing domain-containing protein [Catenuloplanes japonicus]|uniref:nitrate- and nitrite sensing domain-containing protein n=1 Tax=Catenuloplanes japonicus TaxID=33876 RepID=UPI00068B8F9A|nr:nitrate- and nitrite sensing domain-containing protein [Catenuloplanes japonicus]